MLPIDTNIHGTILSTVDNKSFPTWLLNELEKRGWSQADLAKSAKVSRTAISNVLNENRQPGPELCSAIAQAFQLPPEVVFRAAGLLPPDPDMDELDKELLYLFEQLTPEDQEEMLQFAKMKIERRKRADAPKTTPRVDRNHPQTDTH